MALRNDLNDDGKWKEFWKQWDGFIWAIIRKKLYFAPDLWDDCKALVDCKIFRYANGFNVNMEVSPWLGIAIFSCCEDVKRWRRHGITGIGDEELNITATRQIGIIDLDDENMERLLRNRIWQSESGDDLERREMINGLWLCIGNAMEKLNIDKRHKTAFELHYRYEFKLREIAEIYRLPEKTVNNWPGAVLKKILPSVGAGMEKLGYTPCRSAN